MKEVYLRFYYPLLQSLTGDNGNLFPRSKESFQDLGFSNREIEYLKKFQESYYQRYLINRMIESLQARSIDSSQLAFAKELQQILLLVDTSLHETLQDLEEECNARADPASDLESEEEFDLTKIGENSLCEQASFAVYLYSETSLHRLFILWIYHLVASPELLEISLEALPEDQNLLQAFSKYDNEETWYHFFPKGVDLFSQLLQQFYASERLSSKFTHSPLTSFYQRPLGSLLSVAKDSYLRYDYFRTILYYHCCQSVIAAMIHSVVIQLSTSIMSKSDQQIIVDYQEMIQFFLSYSLEDFFHQPHLQSSQPIANHHHCAFTILNDIGTSLHLYIYSMIMKILIINPPKSLSLQQISLKKSSISSRRQITTSIESHSTDLTSIEAFASELVNYLFTSMNAHDYDLSLSEELLKGWRESPGGPSSSPLIIAQGIQRLLSLGQATALLQSRKDSKITISRKLETVKRVIPLTGPEVPVEAKESNENKPLELEVEIQPEEDQEITNQPSPPVIQSYTIIGDREYDRQLYSEAELYLREKYELLMKEIETKRQRTKWQIRRLQSLPEARRQLTVLFEKEQLQWQREHEIRLQNYPFVDPHYTNPLLSAKILPNESSRNGIVQAVVEPDNDVASVALSDLTEDETIFSASVVSGSRATGRKDSMGDIISMKSLHREEEKRNIANKLSSIPENEEAEEENDASIVSKPVTETEEPPKNLVVAEQKIITGNEEVIIPESTTSSNDVPLIDTPTSPTVEKTIIQSIRVTEQKEEEEVKEIEGISHTVSFYNRIKAEFYQHYNQIQQAIQQENLFEQLSSYLPFSLLLIGIHTKGFSFHLQNNQSLLQNSDIQMTTTMITKLLSHDQYPKISSQEDTMRRLYHRFSVIIQSLLSNSNPLTRFYPTTLLHHNNTGKALLRSMLSDRSIQQAIHPMTSIRYFQNLSYFNCMLSHDQQLNQQLFQKIFYQEQLLAIISIFQQFFLISAKHQFLVDLAAELIIGNYDEYVMSFYDLLSMKEIQNRDSSTIHTFTVTPWLYHPQPMHYFRQQQQRKQSIQNNLEEASQTTTLQLPPIWTTLNIYQTIEKLLKLQYYPQEMSRYRKYVHYQLNDEFSSLPASSQRSSRYAADPLLQVWQQFLNPVALSSLQIHFSIPYPMNVFFPETFRSDIALFTQRYLEIYQLMKSYQLMWNELKQWKQYASGRSGSATTTVASDLLNLNPLDSRQTYSHHQYYRILHVYSYSLGNVLSALHQYMNNRMMMANYHLYEQFQQFYVVFLAASNLRQSSSGQSKQSDPSCASSQQISRMIQILQSYSIELSQASFQFERLPTESEEKGKDDKNQKKAQASCLPSLSFASLLELFESNPHRLHPLAMIKYYLTACLEECRLCLAQFYRIIFLEKAKQQQDKMLAMNDLYDTFYSQLSKHQHQKKSKTTTTKEATIKSVPHHHDPSLSVSYDEESMKKSIVSIKFHLLKIQEYQQLIQDHGKRLYHDQSSTNTTSEDSTPLHHYQYKNHLQTLLMYLFPSTANY